MAALLKPPFFVGLPPKGPRTPPGALFCACWVCWHPETLGAHAATQGTVVSSEVGNAFWPFLAFFACSGLFGKNGDFLAAQPPKRSFDRPVRWYLRCLRARDVQSATLPIVYVTSGGSNLPVRPKKRPRVPAGQIQNGSFSTPGARFLALGGISQIYGHVPLGRFFDSTKIPSHTAIRPPKQQISPQKAKKKSPGGIELTTTRRPQQITMGSETMGLTVPLKEPPITPTS